MYLTTKDWGYISTPDGQSALAPSFLLFWEVLSHGSRALLSGDKREQYPLQSHYIQHSGNN